MENKGEEYARKPSPNLQNFDFPSSGSRTECPTQTGWPWQSDTNRSNGSSGDISQAKETGPALSSPGLIRELSNGANTGLWFSFPTRNHQMNIDVYIPFCMLLALMPSLGRAVWGSYPKRRQSFPIHFCTSLSHSNSLGTMLFKSLFYCSWLVMFLCSLGWQRKLRSICTSAWEFLLWGMTVIHLPGHVIPKNNLILVFSLSKITDSLPTFWTLMTKFPSYILTTTPSVSSSLQKLLFLKLFLAKPAAHLELFNELLPPQVPEGQRVSITHPTSILGFLWWTA